MNTLAKASKSMVKLKGNSWFAPYGLASPKLNPLLHRYVKLRGVRWTRYSKTSKFEEEYLELLEAIQDYESNPSDKNFRHLKEESADVLFCLLGISEKNNFDLSDAVELKIKKDKDRNTLKGAKATA